MDRLHILQQVISGPSSLGAVRAQLLDLSYDFDGDDMVALTTEHICQVLTDFVSGAVSAKQVEDWADTVEGRPGIAYGRGSEQEAEAIAGALFRLSTPTINEELTQELAARMIVELRNAL